MNTRSPWDVRVGLLFGAPASNRPLSHDSHGPENSVAVQTDANDDCEKCEEQGLFQQTRSALAFMAGIALRQARRAEFLRAQTKSCPSLTSSSPSRRTNPPPRSASARNS